jgi:hypothetical protein
MSLPVKEALDVIDHTLTAVKLLAPTAKAIASYIAGHGDTMPPQVPEHLRSEVELERLKVRSAAAGSTPPTA